MPVAHHAAGKQSVGWQRGDPVADLIANDAWSGSEQLVGNVRFPPQVEGVDNHADVSGVEALSDIERLSKRGNHSAISRVDRVHRLDAEVDPTLVGVQIGRASCREGA